MDAMVISLKAAVCVPDFLNFLVDLATAASPLLHGSIPQFAASLGSSKDKKSGKSLVTTLPERLGTQ